MSWSPCECVTADVTRSEHRRTRFSLAANHCSASRNQPLKPAVHRALKHHPPKHTPIPPWMHEQKDFFLPPPTPTPPLFPLSINQTPKSGGGKGKEEECNNSAPPHHCIATKRRSAARLLATTGKLKCHRKVTLPPTKKDDYRQINK